jgi:hypothetical protein
LSKTFSQNSNQSTTHKGKKMRLATDNQLIDLAMAAPDDMAFWYERASQSILDFSRRTLIDADAVADVTAILSPRVKVARNARLAASYLLHGETDGIMKARVKAIEHWLRTGVVSQSGQKVRNFARNLKGDLDAVTIDVWACRSFGVDYEGPDSPAKRDDVYQLMAGRYRRLAYSAGISPAGFQAMVWFGIRRDWGIVDAVADLDLCDHIPEGAVC